MTDEERKELRQSRIDMGITKDKIHAIGTEIMDNNMKREFLIHWKKARWLGVALCLTLLILMNACFCFFIRNGLILGFEVFAVSIVILAILAFLLIVFSIILIRLSIRLYIEVGRTPIAMNLAKKFRKKNYYVEMQKCIDADKLLKENLEHLKSEETVLQWKINHLETTENPWEGTY